jgi:hypothetical protein
MLSSFMFGTAQEILGDHIKEDEMQHICGKPKAKKLFQRPRRTVYGRALKRILKNRMGGHTLD